MPIRQLHGSMYPKAQACWELASEWAEQHRHHHLIVFKATGMNVSQNSLTIVDELMEKHPECTHLLYTGDDLTFPPEGLAKLIDADKPIISGISTQKASPFWVNADVDDEGGGRGKLFVTKEMLYQESVVRVARVGSGFMLVKRQVLKDVGYFWDEYYKAFKAHMPERFQGLCPLPYFPVTYNADGKITTGTDYTFCEVAKRCGYTSWVHCGVIIGHLWEQQVSVIDHINWMDLHGPSEVERLYPTQSIPAVETKISKLSEAQTEVENRLAVA